MELTTKSPLRGFFSTRAGTIALALGAAALAAVLVVVGLNAASKPSPGAVSNSVVVANQLIPKGSSGQTIAAQRLFRTSDIARESVVAGAVTDISQLTGTVAVRDIFPGQQISKADFASAAGVLTADLTGEQRAMAVPVDGAHGMVGQVAGGDRVDVLANLDGAGGSVMKVIARDITVLRAPGEAPPNGGAASSAIVLRVGDRTAARLAYATDNGKIWIFLRPGAGAKDSNVDVVTLNSVLAGKPESGR